MKSIYQRDAVNYCWYDNPQDANIVREKFWLQKKLFGIVIYRKRFTQSSTIWDKKKELKKAGF